MASIREQQEIKAIRAELEALKRDVASIAALLQGEVDPNTPFSIPRKPGGVRRQRGKLRETAVPQE